MFIGHFTPPPLNAPSMRQRSAMQFALCRWMAATGVTLGAMLASAAGAATLGVSVKDPLGHPVEGVVVTAVSPVLSNPVPAKVPTAVMDQDDLQFVPQVLVVSAGTSVEFPNNDTVSHQVYSFSPAKRFDLPLYRGEKHPPIVFDRPGLVVLGCNIHDSMIGYIYVTDAPRFGKTDAHGALRLEDLPPGTYRLTFWSPYVADAPSTLTRDVAIERADSAVDLRLQKPLRSSPEPKPRRREWEY